MNGWEVLQASCTLYCYASKACLGSNKILKKLKSVLCLLAIVMKVYMDGSFTVTVYTYFGTNHVPCRSYATSTMC